MIGNKPTVRKGKRYITQDCEVLQCLGVTTGGASMLYPDKVVRIISAHSELEEYDHAKHRAAVQRKQQRDEAAKEERRKLNKMIERQAAKAQARAKRSRA